MDITRRQFDVMAWYVDILDEAMTLQYKGGRPIPLQPSQFNESNH